MLSNRATNNSNTNANQHRRQWSEGVVSMDKSIRFYKDDDRLLILHLLNEYLLAGSNDVLELIRNCSNECFEALVDFIWFHTSQTTDSNEDDLVIYNQRSSLLSSLSSNVHRQGARRRLAIILIDIFKSLATQTTHGGRFDLQRQQRLLSFPQSLRPLISYEPDICGLSCLSLASLILINPLLIHHHLQLVTDALKHAANQFVKAHLSFHTPSIFAVSIYSLFYLLYILYPNILRRELQPDGIQPVSNAEKQTQRLGIEKVLLPLYYHFKLHPSIACGSIDNEKQENRWSNESWQQIIATGERYVVSDEMSPLLSSDFRKTKDDDLKASSDSARFEINEIIRMCNGYTDSVLHLNENKSQIGEETITKAYVKKPSTDCYSNYSETYCQTYEQQWQTTIQNGQIHLSRAQSSAESNRRQTSNGNGSSTKKDSQNNNNNTNHSNGQSIDDHHIHAKVQLQLNMLDCNYEQDKREYYAQLIRDAKKAIPFHDLEKELRHHETEYEQLIKDHEKAATPIHHVVKQVNEYHMMNEAFYNSLSATRVELKTDEDDLWQKQSSFAEKQSKLNQELAELTQRKKSLESELRDIQRRLFEAKQDGKQSTEFHDLAKKLSIELICARKKHQLLHNALVHLNLKAINAEKLIVMHQTSDDFTEEQPITLEEKKKKFDELKTLIEKQHADLTTKRNQFHQQRIMNTQKINMTRRQLDSIRVCKTMLLTMNTNSQISDPQQ